MAKTTKISATAMSTYLSCKRKYFFYKTEKFKGALAFEFGKAFEFGLEEYVKTKDKNASIESAVKKFQEADLYNIAYTELEDKEMTKGVDTKDRIMVNYLIDETNKVIAENKELLPQMVERLIDFVVDNEINISQMQITTIATMENGNNNEIRIDGLCTKDNKTYIFELKSYKTFKSNAELKHDLQLLNYVSVLKKKGVDVDGVLFLQVKKAIPEEVKLLKNGKLSIAKTQKCLPEDYYNTALEIYGVGNIPDDVLETYSELLNSVEFIRASIIEFTDKEINNYWSQLLHFSEELAEMNHLLKANEGLAYDKCFPNYGIGCSMCNYKMKCWG